MSMIEKVARALALADLDEETRRIVDLDAHMAHVEGHYRELARAAIEAMREPTTEMLRGLLVHRGYDPDAKEETLDALGQLDVSTMGALVGNYRAMIDSILAEGQ